MNILILGSGGREHAMAWKIIQSPLCEKLFIAPGNAGTAAVGVNVAVNPEDFDAVAKLVAEHAIDLMVVGPEAPLVAGIRDYFESNSTYKGLRIVGPGKAGAQLEGSKDFSKQFMMRHQIPTAAYRTFNRTQIAEAQQFLETLKAPYVLKADGLAAGKGVLIINDLAEAKMEIADMLGNERFGLASARVVIEEFLSGIELSVFALTDGKDYVLLPEAKDYKRIGEGDTGPNTGGMGAVSPVPFAGKAFMEKVVKRIVQPTISGLKQDGIPYIGFVFFGLINVGGEPFVIEYNARMGDPETEVVMPRLKSDLVPLLVAAAEGTLSGKTAEFDHRMAATVMMVSGGYPGDYEKGKEITGLSVNSDVMVFHAGTVLKEGKVLSNGGRVLAVTAYGNKADEALGKIYDATGQIAFEGKYYRRDIGADLA
jgi:phosphoribosylamine--glycine ligase